ncbi:hypothetical protein Ancab_015496 [Ancistrocladus abbreviatus]
MLGLGSGRVVDSSATSPLISSVSAAATEAVEFVAAFESEYGGLRTRPNFAAKGFMDALQRSRHAYTGPSEGFKMSNSLKASRFPCCAVVMAAMNLRIALLLQVRLLAIIHLYFWT